MSYAQDTLKSFQTHGKTIFFHHINDLNGAEKLPFSLKILLENLVRHEDGITVKKEDIDTLLNWDPNADIETEISFHPARVLMQDFTGVPAIVDLAAMRDAILKLQSNPSRINPLEPVELVIDHSVQVDYFGSDEAFGLNAALEFERNQERYAFLKWGQKAFSNFKVVPPDTGIVHQVNLEYLARVVFLCEQADGSLFAYPDTVVGTDSHTTMINGLGVLGWGVGGIEAEAALLGQPISMLIPKVVGFRLVGQLREGTTATDLVLTIVQMLRKKGVVGKFIEFFGPGLHHLSLADRTTISNMAPEYGATSGIFPIDRETLRYLALTGRTADQIDLIEAYARAQGLFHLEDIPEAQYSDLFELDLAEVEPCIAGPRRPQDRIPLRLTKKVIGHALEDAMQARRQRHDSREAAEAFSAEGGRCGNENDAIIVVSEARFLDSTQQLHLRDGMIVIAAITSCTNTSNPSAMIGAGILARKAHKLGLSAKPWVKTSLGPGSRVVTEYLEKAGLMPDLDALGFSLVGYGCTTCIGNSGPLPGPISAAIHRDDLTVCSVLSGNRNFEGRIHPDIKMNFLASPPLVVAYAIVGHMEIDFTTEPLGEDIHGHPVYLRDIWPSQDRINAVVQQALNPEQFKRVYADIFAGESRWGELQTPDGELFAWDNKSTYIRKPPYFDQIDQPLQPIEDIKGARVLAKLGDSVTTDHISPAGSIAPDSPAGQYLREHGVDPVDFNSYGSRRGNHEVMMRGTFANIRLRNQLVPESEGGITQYLPSNEQMTIYDAAMRYRAEGIPTIVVAGIEYGTGSSRDWAAKGPSLLGMRAVLAKSFERIHRSNLVGMGILPLQFMPGESAEIFGLTGREIYDIDEPLNNGQADKVRVTATDSDGSSKNFQAIVRIDTPQEVTYYRHGGILPYVLRQLVAH